MSAVASVDLLALSDLGQKDRIQILLAEYTTLRTEIIHRTGWGFQIAWVVFLAGTWLVAQYTPEWALWQKVVIGAIAVGVTFSIAVNLEGISYCATRVRELELEINSRAAEHLLVWEAVVGADAQGGFLKTVLRGSRYRDRDSALPPLVSSYLEAEALRNRNRSKQA